MQLESGDFDHRVNLVTAHVFCNGCIKSGRWNKPLEENECDVCGDERFLCWAPFNFTAEINADRIAVVDDPLTAFNHWLLFETSKRYKSLCFVRNFNSGLLAECKSKNKSEKHYNSIGVDEKWKLFWE